MWNKIKYKLFDKPIYVLFYWVWDKKFAESPELCSEFLDTFKIYRFQEPVEVSDIAKDYAIRWNRTTHAKTVENLGNLIEEAIYESRNRSK